MQSDVWLLELNKSWQTSNASVAIGQYMAQTIEFTTTTTTDGYIRIAAILLILWLLVCATFWIFLRSGFKNEKRLPFQSKATRRYYALPKEMKTDRYKVYKDVKDNTLEQKYHWWNPVKEVELNDPYGFDWFNNYSASSGRQFNDTGCPVQSEWNTNGALLLLFLISVFGMLSGLKHFAKKQSIKFVVILIFFFLISNVIMHGMFQILLVSIALMFLLSKNKLGVYYLLLAVTLKYINEFYLYSQDTIDCNIMTDPHIKVPFILFIMSFELYQKRINVQEVVRWTLTVLLYLWKYILKPRTVLLATRIVNEVVHGKNPLHTMHVFDYLVIALLSLELILNLRALLREYDKITKLTRSVSLILLLLLFLGLFLLNCVYLNGSPLLLIVILCVTSLLSFYQTNISALTIWLSSSMTSMDVFCTVVYLLTGYGAHYG